MNVHSVMRIVVAVSLVAFPGLSCAQSISDDLILYKWIGPGGEAMKDYSSFEANIHVPEGFKEDHWFYGEGVVTTLSYSDGSYIVLHFGLTMSLPLLKPPTHELEEEKKLEDSKIRHGKIQGTDLYWREVHFNSKAINIAFSEVPKEHIDLFNQALDSFQYKRTDAP